MPTPPHSPAPPLTSSESAAQDSDLELPLLMVTQRAQPRQSLRRHGPLTRAAQPGPRHVSRNRCPDPNIDFKRTPLTRVPAK